MKVRGEHHAVFAATFALAASSFVTGCGKSKPAVEPFDPPTPRAVVIAPAPTPAPETPLPAPTEFEPWADMGFGRYMLPKGQFWSDDGAVDIVFHFHAGEAAESDYRASGLRAIVVSEQWGTFSGPYSAAFEDHYRFGRMVGAIVAAAKSITKVKTIHRGRIALVAWSAGYGSVQEILKDARYREWVDTVVLLDGLHAGHVKGSGEGPRSVDAGGLYPFLGYAREAAAGRKTFVLTHSSIVPEGYASTTECVQHVANEVSAAPTNAPFLHPRTADARPMKQVFRADVGQFHAIGFEGIEARDHIHQLHLLDEVLAAYVVPAWSVGRPKI